MSKTSYFKRRNGRQPAKEWYDGQDNTVQISIAARLDALRENWRDLDNTGILVKITGAFKEPGFYELKHTGKKWRLFVFYDFSKDTFILLEGFRKTKPSKSEQEAAIKRANGYIQEYRSM